MALVALCAVIAVATAGFAFQQVASARDRRRYPGVGRRIDVGGHHQYLDCRGGGGPTVVLEAGSGGSSMDWRAVLPGIARFTRVCAYDRAGYGRSDPGPTPRSTERIASELHELLRRAGEKPPFVLVGHSLGGLLGGNYAATYPRDVAGFVFVDGGTKPFYEDLDRRYPQWFKGAGRLAMIADLGGIATRFGLTRLVRQPAAPHGFGPELRGEAYALGYQPKVYHAFADETRAVKAIVTRARSDFRRDVPAVILTHGDPGDMWRGVPERGAEEVWQRGQADLARSFPAAKHEVIRGSGHFIQIDAPNAVIDAIRSVVERAR